MLRRGKIARHAKPVVHQRGGLNLADQVHNLLAFVFLLMVEPVKPDQGHRSVSGEKFPQLGIHVIEVSRPLRPRGIAVPGVLDGFRSIAKARMVHVRR